MPVLEAPPKVGVETKSELLKADRSVLSTWIPVNPSRLRSGALVSLAKVLGEDKAHPVPFGDPAQKLSSGTLIASDIDISLAAKLSIGSIFSGNISYGDRAFYLDFTEYLDKYAEMPSTPVVGTRWGVGIRVLLHVTDIKAGINLNVGIVGAAVDLGYAKALYEINIFGVEGGMEVVLGELHGFGTLNAETYFKITDMVMPKVSKYMQENPAKLLPVPFQVQLIQPLLIDPILHAKPILFAMRRIRDGKTFNQAVIQAGGKYDREEIKTVYLKLAPDTPPNEEPPQSACEAANEWLRDN